MTRQSAVAVLATVAVLGIGATIAPTSIALGPAAVYGAPWAAPGSAAPVIDTERSWPIVYRVTGDGTTAASITWTDGGSESQAIDVRLPWSVSLPAGALPGHIVLAQAGDGTMLTCTIMQGRRLIDATTGVGRGAMALCQE